MTALRLGNKTSRKMITAVAFGLVMLSVVIWLFLAFHADIRSKTDSSAVSNVMLQQNNISDDILIAGTKSRDLYEGMKGRQLTVAQTETLPSPAEQISWLTYIVKSSLGERSSFTADGLPLEINGDLTFKILLSDKVFPSCFDEYLIAQGEKGVLSQGGFTNSKAEMLVSAKLLRSLGIDPSNAIGIRLSLSVDYTDMDFLNEKFILDNDNLYGNEHAARSQNNAIPSVRGSVTIFENYAIAGVISDAYYSINDLTQNDCDIWLNHDSIVTDSQTDLYPRISVQDVYVYDSQEAKIVATYPSSDYTNYSAKVATEGCFFPFVLGNDYLSPGNPANNSLTPVVNSFVQCKDLSSAINYVNTTDYYISSNSPDGAAYYSFCSNAFNSLKQLYDAVNVASAVLACIGTITLMAVILNYANIACFNARKRRSYMRMLMNIGITARDKRRLVFAETFVSLAVSLLSAFIVGLVISLIIGSQLPKLLTRFAVFSGITIALWPYFVGFAILTIPIVITFAGITINANHNGRI